MKKTVITMSLALVLAAAQAPATQAGKKEWAAVAGFVGGVLVANAAHGHNAYYHEPVRVHHHHTKVIYEPSASVYHHPPHHRGGGRHRAPPPPPQGYYEWRTERVWVPGAWMIEELRCGTRRRVWQPGHYQMVRNRVWVNACAW